MHDIELKDIYFSYPGEKRDEAYLVFDGFSHSFKGEKTHLIIGGSGAGKTTLIRLIAGLVTQEKGEIIIDGMDVSNQDLFKRKISYVSQDIFLYPHVSIFNSMASPLVFAHKDTAEIRMNVRTIARSLGIEHCLTRKPKNLSLGQIQRAMIGRALLREADIYLFDEPLSNQDTNTKKEVLETINAVIKERKATLIYVTHHAEDVLAFSDYIHVMDEGKITMSGQKDDLLKTNDEIKAYLGL